MLLGEVLVWTASSSADRVLGCARSETLGDLRIDTVHKRAGAEAHYAGRAVLELTSWRWLVIACQIGHQAGGDLADLKAVRGRWSGVADVDTCVDELRRQYVAQHVRRDPDCESHVVGAFSNLARIANSDKGGAILVEQGAGRAQLARRLSW